MILPTLFFSGRDWLLPSAVALGAALLILFWAYRKAPAAAPVRALCLVLKILGLVALAACLLEPLWSGQRAKPGSNFFAIVADNSQGMQIKDRGESRSRGDLLHGVLTTTKNGWLTRLDENFQVRRYVFDSRLQSTRDFSELVFDGRASSIGTALRTISERYQGQPLAGVLLLTDGNATDIPDGVPDVTGLPPIYPVVIGSDQPIKDIAVNNVTVSQTSFEDAPVSIQADVTAPGYSGDNIVAQLFEVASASTNRWLRGKQSAAPRPAEALKSNAGTRASDAVVRPAAGGPAGAVMGKVVAEQTLKAPRDGQTMPFRFQIRPDKSGVLFYRLRVSAKSELGQFTDPSSSSEATLANNSRVLVVDRGRGPYRVLYVSGRPNWEYKFLSRALAEDDQVELVGLIRVARREPKFDFKGRAGESSNPLFRGFGNQSKEEIERYDQPVLVRLNTRDEAELRGGFPKTAEELYSYHAVVLDDLEAEFFTPDQMMLLQKFVSERGGGFLMLGGVESFHPGRFHHTPIGDMLPVYIDQVAESKPGELRLTLTREGWLQPWARLRNNEADERTRLSGMPPFQTLNQVRGVKPGASVIATVADAVATNQPALVVQRFGDGRVGALALGDLWHWGLRDEAAHRDMDKAWRQMIRWLVADVPNRIDLQAEAKRGDADGAVQLQARARDKKFQPLENATVSLTVRFVGENALTTATNKTTPAATGTNFIRMTAEAAAAEAGLYQSTYIPRESGGYLAEAIVTDASGVEVGRDEVGWTANPAAEEFRSLKPNRALLETIARKSGGEIIAVNKLDDFARSLPSRKVPITENWTTPVWHQPAVFLFALICFVAEWGLRRWKGLA